MDLSRILKDLKAEREALAVAIDRLENVARNGRKRRGRPPAWLKALHPSASAASQVRPARAAAAGSGFEFPDDATAGMSVGEQAELEREAEPVGV